MALEINAQFKQFVQFARQQANPATSEAIARVTGTEDALAGRSISASNTDHVRGVFNWSGRSDTDAARNNETRALFRKAVADIFGGEGKIPKTVRDAMRLKDYGTPERPLGKPLTARRIMAVNKAILRILAEDAVNGATQDINEMGKRPIYKRVPFEPVGELTPAQRRKAVDATLRHGRGLNDWGVRVLARYAVLAIEFGLDVNNILRRVKPSLVPFRSIPAGDPGFKAVNDRIFEISKDILDGYMSPEGAQHFDKDGLFDNFTADADRSYHTINGKALDKDKKAVEDGFKDAVKDIRHRKALSCFMSQMSQGTVINMSNRFDEYVDVMKLEGAESFISFDIDNGPFDVNPILVGNSYYTLEVSGDGKSAKITSESKSLLTFGFPESLNGRNFPVGSVSWKQEYFFDLKGDMPVLTDARIIQELDAGAGNDPAGPNPPAEA